MATAVSVSLGRFSQDIFPGGELDSLGVGGGHGLDVSFFFLSALR